MCRTELIKSDSTYLFKVGLYVVDSERVRLKQVWIRYVTLSWYIYTILCHSDVWVSIALVNVLQDCTAARYTM